MRSTAEIELREVHVAQEKETGPYPPKIETKPREPIPRDTVLIGIKPLMRYVTAVMMHFQSGAKEVTLKARGRAISKAVDVVEVVRRSFGGKLAIKEVTIGTQVIEEADYSRHISIIEIKLHMAE
jgi:DNA-binding protein